MIARKRGWTKGKWRERERVYEMSLDINRVGVNHGDAVRCSKQSKGTGAVTSAGVRLCGDDHVRQRIT